MTAVAQWDDLLAGEELAYLTTEPARAARTAPFPDELHPKVRAALSAHGITELYAHQAEAWHAARSGGHVIVTTGTASGQDARVQPAGARLARGRAEEPRPLSLPDEGARAGPGARARRARRAGRPRLDLRRRHADGAAPSHPALGQPHPHQPRHAPHRRPAAARPLGGRAAQPPLRRRRRGARLPRRLRLARRERAPPPAPARARLRVGAAAPARLGDDREPGRARARTARSRGDRRGRRCGAAGRAHRRPLEPGAARRGARAARQARSARPRACSQRSSSATCARSASRRAARPPSSCTG